MCSRKSVGKQRLCSTVKVPHRFVVRWLETKEVASCSYEVNIGPFALGKGSALSSQTRSLAQALRRLAELGFANTSCTAPWVTSLAHGKGRPSRWTARTVASSLADDNQEYLLPISAHVKCEMSLDNAGKIFDLFEKVRGVRSDRTASDRYCQTWKWMEELVCPLNLLSTWRGGKGWQGAAVSSQGF